MTQKLRNLLEQAQDWSEEEQEELLSYAQGIEVRRSGVYVMTNDERKAVEEGMKSPLVSDEEMVAFWKKHGIS